MTTLKQLIDHLNSLTDKPEEIEVMVRVNSVDGDWSSVEHIELGNIKIGDRCGDYTDGEDDDDFDPEKPTVIISVASV